MLSLATHLYFDIAQEPSPEERGFYWSERYTDTRKVFEFMPGNVYSGVYEKPSGEKKTRDEICGDEGQECPNLKEEFKENIAGKTKHKMKH